MISAPDHDVRWRLILRWVCPVALLGLYVVLACAGLTRDSMTFDELGHLTGGFSSWTERDHRLFPQNGQLPKRWGTLPLLASDVRLPSTEQLNWWHSDLDGFGHEFLYEMGNDLGMILTVSRATMVVTGVLLGLVVFAWSSFLFGRAGGCLSLALCTFSPALQAHGRLVTSDVTSALTFLAALLCLWEVVHRITIVRVILCAGAVGLLLVSKMSGLLIVPIAAILVVLRLVHRMPLHVALPRHARVVRHVSHKLAYLSAVALVVGAGAVTVIWAFYDFRYAAFRESVDRRDRFYGGESIDTLTTGKTFGAAIRLARNLQLLPESYLFGLAHVLAHSRAHPSFMNGRYSLRGWRLYFPYTVLVKTPLPVFGIAVIAAWAAVAPNRARRSLRPSGRVAGRLVLRTYRTAPLWVFLATYWAVALSVHLSIGERHLLPTYPAVFILCGAAGRWIQHRQRLCTGALLGSIVWLVVESVGICPSYLSYFNQLAGGPTEGYRHLVDSSLDWGQDLARLREWLEDRPAAQREGRTVYLAYFGSGDPARSGIQVTLLPCYLDWRDAIDFEELQPGTYCISATMLQSVYSFAFGPWHDGYETMYRKYSRRAADWYGTRVPLRRVRSRQGDRESRLIYEFEQLRFARLCAHLRRREPDDRVAYSILIYEVSRTELDSALGRE